MPMPESVVVERRPRAKGRSATDILKAVTEQFPGLVAHLDGTDVLVRGTVEEHEAVSVFLNPSTIRKPAVPGLAPLRKRLFGRYSFAFFSLAGWRHGNYSTSITNAIGERQLSANVNLQCALRHRSGPS